MGHPAISFEFFPPKTKEAHAALLDAAQTLVTLSPAFMTVTFGAGGSTRDGTLSTLSDLQKITSVPLGCHLTFISLTKTELCAYLDTLWDKGIRHIVALRGDLPKGLSWPLNPDADYFQFTSDFVEAIKARHPFEVSVGAYPDKHPDAPDLAADIIALKKKCDAGADRAITQFFFDCDRFESFLEKVTHAGITTPIVPGLLPIHNYESMLKFAGRCGAFVPDAIRVLFEGKADSDHPAIAQDLLRTQIEDLKRRGVQNFHFYTLNKAEGLVEACRKTGLGL